MVKKKPEPEHESKKSRKARASRDYSQRAHDTVREVEKRHAERHRDDESD